MRLEYDRREHQSVGPHRCEVAAISHSALPQVRRGLESLAISQAQWRQLGLPDFAAAITGISCADHNGHQAAYVQQWDGTKWIAPMTDRLRPLLQAAVRDYVSKDPAWPKRTEPCDKSS